MEHSTFFDNFEVLAGAPTGVQKLREMVLQLAVQGKLLTQDPDDEPASVLLEKIQAEKKRLISEGVVKKSPILPPVDKDEKTFKVSGNWEWERLGNVCSYIQRGKGPKYAETSDVPVISQKCIQWSGFDIDRARFVDPSSLKKYGNERFLRTGDLLWNSTGTGTIGRLNVYVHEDNPYQQVVADSHVTVVRPIIINSEFILIFLSSPCVQYGFEERASGTTNQIELNTSTVKSQVLPIPPIDEQKRIVAKVDELMALCDDLEARKQKTHQACIQLNDASIDKLLTAPTPTKFNRHWQRICDNFDLLYGKPENVTKLRQTILQLAVQGKLVRQNPHDEPASTLLEKIKAEGEHSIGVRGKRFSRKLPASNDEALPYILPKGWVWATIANLLASIDAGWSPACEKFPSRSEHRWGLLKTTSVQELQFLPEHNKELPDHLNARAEYEVKLGDLLITRAGPKNRVGICCLVKATRPRLMLSDKIIRCRFLGEGVYLDNEYIALSMNAGASKDFLEKKKSGMAESQMNISQQKLRMTPIGIPPYNEQLRIVAKVDKLMGLCDELERKLSNGLPHLSRLVETAVYSLFAA